MKLEGFKIVKMEYKPDPEIEAISKKFQVESKINIDILLRMSPKDREIELERIRFKGFDL